MLKNFFKVAWRNLFRNRVSAFINISGLAVGMAVAMLIGLWIVDELSFNAYHKNYDRIVKVMDHQSHHGETYSNDALPIPLGTSLRLAYGNDFKSVTMMRETEEHTLASGDKQFTQMGNFMQADGPAMLSLEMLSGTHAGLKDLHSILLSASLAEKLFGSSDPVGKIVRIDAATDVKVTGVFKDLPNSSEFRATTFIAPFDLYGANADDWGNYNMFIFAQLQPNADVDKVSAKIKNVLTENIKEQDASHSLFIQPMSKWHLHSAFENGVPVVSQQMKFIWFYGIIGAFVLLLACINFMNLSTARSEKRAREVGIRKTIGSLRRQLVYQFYCESLVIALFAFIVSLVLVQLTLPWFNNVADKNIAILWANPWFWFGGIVFTIVTGLLAGSYPALYISSFQPIKVLKGNFRVGRLSLAPRKVLVVVQFTISVALIIGTAIVYRQIQYAKDRPVGYSQAGLITLQVKSPDFDQKYTVLETGLNTTGVIASIARANYSVTDTRGWNGGFAWEGKPAIPDQSFNTISVSGDYGRTVGWELTAGRDFSKTLASDSAAIILNEAAVKLAGLQNPVGQTVRWEPGWREPANYKIIGVVKDMVKGSPFQPTYPSVIFLGGGNWLLIKINPAAGMHTALAKMENVFKKITPTVPFDYTFIDEEYAAKFAAEERVSTLAGFFAALAIFISCMGLFGLASFVAEQRIKEIGVRKILGASIFNLWGLLSKDFMLLVIISCAIAIPIAWYFLHEWLQQYQYRTGMPWWIFAGTIASAVMITLLTVSIQAIKAAIVNPVKSLRSE